MKTEQEVKDAINVLTDYCNTMSPSVKLSTILTSVVTREHRTIQQALIKSLNDFLVEYSDASFDGRNEQSVIYAKKIKELDHYFPFI